MNNIFIILLIVSIFSCTQDKNGLADKSKTIITKPKTESAKELSGIYEYVYEHNTEDLTENHYLEFKGENAFYFGTTDDFDDAREGYNPGFFMAQVDDMELDINNISFSLTVSDSILFKKPITPLYQTNGNERWGIGISNNTRNYKGKIIGDTITITTKDFDPRKFIKKKSR